MTAVSLSLRGRGALRFLGGAERGRVRQRSFSVLNNWPPPARPHRDMPVSAAAVAAARRSASASAERPRSLEWQLSSAKASWADASSAQEQHVMDDDELERRLNGPGAIATAAAAAATSSKSGRPPRVSTNGAARPATKRKPLKNTIFPTPTTNGASKNAPHSTPEADGTTKPGVESETEVFREYVNESNGEYLNGINGPYLNGINGEKANTSATSQAARIVPRRTSQSEEDHKVAEQLPMGMNKMTGHCTNPLDTLNPTSSRPAMSVFPVGRPASEVEDDFIGESWSGSSNPRRNFASRKATSASARSEGDVYELDGSVMTAVGEDLITMPDTVASEREASAERCEDFESFLENIASNLLDKAEKKSMPPRAATPAHNMFEDADKDSDGLSARSFAELERMQREREERSQAEACEKYCKMLNDMVSFGKVTNLKPVQRILLTWYRPLMERIEAEQAAVWEQVKDADKVMVAKGGTFGGRNVYGPLLVLLKADKLAVLVMHEVVNLCLADGNKGVPTLKACKQVAELVQQEVNDLRLRNKLGSQGVKKLKMSGRRHVRQVNKLAENALESLEYADWPLAARIKLGAALIKYLLESASWSEDGRPAFIHEVRSTKVRRRHGVVAMDSAVYNKMLDEDVSSFVEPRFVPMLVPPLPWTRTDMGGYYNLKSHVMRTWGDKGQKAALRLANLGRIYEGLNCLGKVKWRINAPILDIATEAWAKDLEVGDLPKRAEVPLPEVPAGLKMTNNGIVMIARKEDYDNAEMKQLANTFRRSVKKVKTKNANLHSMRCDLKLKIAIAEEFREHRFYFPYNLDFRGRTYPLPPNLNILGSDFCRGVLMFDEARPLGERGLYWLKVHLANLYGQDKIGFDDRVSFVEERLNEIRDSAEKPLNGEGWWMSADKPWQCLSACRELTRALDSPDPAEYKSRLPVHQDGSCNGLQHYAALGLDAKGGAQVNLVPSSKPQDVYSGVCEIVKKKVAAEAAAIPRPGASDEEVKRHRIAKMVDGKIDRKVVKQTVMTSVYGVTFVGARKQIQNQIEEKLNTGEVMTDEDEADAYSAASYLAKHTMNVLGELFTEARGIMEWLMEVAVLVAKEGQPVTWVTPLGLPVMQPYRRNNAFQVQTLLQGVLLLEQNENLPVAIARQKSAFPPNFVHSLDSTHMLLTAMEMDRAGVPFAAVHDSYWVHAGNIDDMNAKLRQCFVDMYSGPILEELSESLSLRYPTIDFPPIPARGSLTLNDVKDSKYFFN